MGLEISTIPSFVTQSGSLLSWVAVPVGFAIALALLGAVGSAVVRLLKK